jgi:hypothetical protein
VRKRKCEKVHFVQQFLKADVGAASGEFKDVRGVLGHIRGV